MATMSVAVSIKGISPLLMHAFPLEPITALEKKTPEEQAELAAYRDDKGLFIPGIAIQRALVNGATFVKGRGRASLQKPVAACVYLTPEHVALDTTTYILDARAVVVPATKGRIVRYRPRLDVWAASFTLEYDPDMLSEKQLREIVDNTGRYVGLLDFRPEKKGPMGRFMVISWIVEK